MNRVIKFRAWDKVSNQWTTMGMWQDTRSRLFGISEHERVVVMQFTGLKDKNGKEIYEGDTLRIDLGDDGDDFLPVFWDNEAAMFMYGVNSPESLSEAFYFDVYIAGNIYEHPELLNSDQNAQVSDTTDD